LDQAKYALSAKLPGNEAKEENLYAMDG